MHRCLQCAESFQYWQVFDSLFKGYRVIQCAHCQEKQEITTGSRMKGAMGTVAIPIVVARCIVPTGKLGQIGMYLIFAILMLFILPYFMRYKNKSMGK